MMSVNAVIRVTVLPHRTWVHPAQQGNSVELVLCRIVIVNERARVSLGTPPQEMVVTELVVIFSSFDAVHGHMAGLDRLIQSTRSRVPV